MWGFSYLHAAHPRDFRPVSLSPGPSPDRWNIHGGQRRNQGAATAQHLPDQETLKPSSPPPHTRQVLYWGGFKSQKAPVRSLQVSFHVFSKYFLKRLGGKKKQNLSDVIFSRGIHFAVGRDRAETLQLRCQSSAPTMSQPPDKTVPETGDVKENSANNRGITAPAPCLGGDQPSTEQKCHWTI